MAEIELINPLDYMILDDLPDTGTLHFGAYPVGKTAKQLKEEVAEGKLTVNVISSRLRYMHLNGYVGRVKGLGTSGLNVWQRTPEGVRVLNEWRKNESR